MTCLIQSSADGQTHGSLNMIPRVEHSLFVPGNTTILLLQPADVIYRILEIFPGIETRGYIDFSHEFTIYPQ